MAEDPSSNDAPIELESGTYEIIRHRGSRTLVTKGQNRPSEGHKYYENVCAHMTKGTPLVITPEWSRRPIHILDLADQSARKGVSLRVTHK